MSQLMQQGRCSDFGDSTSNPDDDPGFHQLKTLNQNLQAMKCARFCDKPFQAPPAMMNIEPTMTVIRRPKRVHSQSPMKLQKMAGRKREAVMIPNKLPLGVPKYL
jgi:hypothetical protein